MEPQKELLGRLLLAGKIIRETPMVELSHEKIDLYAKLEYVNGIGSIKDRTAFWILNGAVQRGDVGPNTTIVESSSGNFACALATLCFILKLKFIPVIDPNISPFYEAYLRAYCRTVVKVEEADAFGNYLETRLRTVQTLCRRIDDSYWTNQYENPDGMAAHYEATAGEICRSAPHLDYVFLGVSSGGTIAGVSRRLKEHYAGVKVIAVDAEGSAIFRQIPRKRYIPGIGSSISPGLLRNALIDEVAIVPELEAVAGCREMLDRHGLFVGGSTGTVYSAIQRYFSRQQMRNRPAVLFLCCDKGTAYLHNVYDEEWVQSHLANSSAAPTASKLTVGK
jgi:N-(2-amino-2-carboxyethyl)-L-glutamate synthase